VRRWIILLVLLVSGIAFLHSRPLDVHVQDIESVTLEPQPEGPTLTFTRGAPLHSNSEFPFEAIERYVPDPLPNTAWQVCTEGGDLVVTLADGDSVRYGPCRRPESINALWAHMIDVSSDGGCRPRCGPGGLPGP
jgi:hypothetical protein